MKEKNAEKKVQIKEKSKEKLPAKSKKLRNNMAGNRGNTPLGR